MPLYEYECPTCGTFELIRKFSDAPVVACPTCGREVVKLQSAPAFQFKGTGWYVTDYARKGKDTSTEAKGGDKTKAAESSGSGSKSSASESKVSGSDSSASSSESKSAGSETKSSASEAKVPAASSTTKSGSS